MDKELEQSLNETFALELKESTYEKIHAALVAKVNELLNNNFTQLVYVLYKVDVSEPKLKRLLKENNATDAADIIAALIIERQLQKIRSRRDNRRDNNDFTEEEKW